MQWMLDVRSYGMKISFNTTSVGYVTWRDGGDTKRALLQELMFMSDAKSVSAGL